MSSITGDTTREELAAIVVQKLDAHQIKAVLVGGSVVSIYTANKYESRDLDFISMADHAKISDAMEELGFRRKGKDFIHPDTDFSVEFPTGPLAIGDDVPVVPAGRIVVDGVEITLLSPTQSVMDRLISFFVFNDRQCLDQAIWITEINEVDLEEVSAWAKRERYEDKLQVFLNRIKNR